MEKLHGQQVGENQTTLTPNKENYSEKIKLVKGTPFAIVERKKNENIIVFGKYMITNKTFYSETEARQWINLLDWNAILNVIGIYIEERDNFKKLENNE